VALFPTALTASASFSFVPMCLHRTTHVREFGHRRSCRRGIDDPKRVIGRHRHHDVSCPPFVVELRVVMVSCRGVRHRMHQVEHPHRGGGPGGRPMMSRYAIEQA